MFSIYPEKQWVRSVGISKFRLDFILLLSKTRQTGSEAQQQTPTEPDTQQQTETSDYSTDTGTAGVVTVGGSATGEVGERGDRDWFAVDLTAGTHYRIDLEGSPTGDGPLWDTYLYGIYDSDGYVIQGTANDDVGTGRNSRVYFEAPTDGTYYVAAGAYFENTGTYTLSVAVDPIEDNFAAMTSTTSAVTVGGSATGEIDYYGDQDWFAVELAAGARYRIDLEGDPTWYGPRLDPYLRGIYDSDGQLLPGTTNDNLSLTGRDSEVYFKTTTDGGGTYYVAAGANGSSTGAYTLSVTAIPMDDFAAAPSTSGRVTVGGSATGDIEERNDQDWFAVDLTAGNRYRIDLEGSQTGDGTLGDPSLRGIYDSDGQFIPDTTNDDAWDTFRNSRVYFEAPTDSTYYVAAGAYNVYTGTYTLSVVEDAI